LAIRAQKGASIALPQPAYVLAALSAHLTFPLIDIQVHLVTPALTFYIPEIGDARSPVTDRAF
jgi:hypothetical protein